MNVKLGWKKQQDYVTRVERCTPGVHMLSKYVRVC